MAEIISASEVPGGRCYRFMEINRLKVGEAVFFSDKEIGQHSVDRPALMRQHAYNRGRLLGGKFRTHRGMYKERRGTFVVRTE